MHLAVKENRFCRASDQRYVRIFRFPKSFINPCKKLLRLEGVAISARCEKYEQTRRELPAVVEFRELRQTLLGQFLPFGESLISQGTGLAVEESNVAEHEEHSNLRDLRLRTL